jgi:isochorismate hydrolase
MTKQRYFTPESIGQKSRQMLEEVSGLRSKHELRLSPKHSALLVLDMQRYFLEESSHACIPAAQAIVHKIVALVESYYQKSLPIIFTRHLNSTADAKMMTKWWRDFIERDDPLSGIIPEFDLTRGMLIEKSQYDAFYETRLEEILRQKGATQVVICGVMAHLCCETTARSAFVRGFEVFFTINGTATYNERFHRATLLNLAHGFAIPVLIDEILADLSRADEN